MNIVLEAIQFANKKHEGQFRRAGEPYITHPIAVSYIVASYKHSGHLQELLAAAVLHDTLEDTDTSYEELVEKFGELVAGLVRELSNDEAEIERLGKYEYQARKLMAMSSWALVLKLADRLHNISDAPTKTMLRNTLELMDRLKNGRELSLTHLEMMADIEAKCREKLT